MHVALAQLASRAPLPATHRNIIDANFTDETVAQYDLVFNALDNQDARRRMNALCVLAKVPLFEAGSTGYLGQSYTILPKVTPCFDCVPKPVPKTYPVCTIRRYVAQHVARQPRLPACAAA